MDRLKKRILIVKTGAAGDVLRTTCLLEGLHERHEKPIIDWVIAGCNASLLQNNTLVSAIYIMGELKDDSDLYKKEYDLVVSLDDDYASAQVASQVDAKQIVGASLKGSKVIYSADSEPWFGMGLLRPSEAGGKEMADMLKRENRRTVQEIWSCILGVKCGDYVFNLSEDELNEGARIAERLGAASPIVGLNTGAGKRWQQKSIGIARAAELAGMIQRRGYGVLLLGGSEEMERNREIAKRCRFTAKTMDAALQVRSFAALLSRCDAVVCSDSLALHLSLALKKKTVAFFGPTSPHEIEMYGRGIKIVAPCKDVSCYRKECDVRPSCMEIISVDEIVRALEKLVHPKA